MSADKPIVMLETSKGDITIESDGVKAPISTQNFLQYVEAGFYKNTIFHRVIPGFMIQGGGLLFNMKQKDPWDPIKNEAGNGLRNKRGTLAMARTNVVDAIAAVKTSTISGHQDVPVDPITIKGAAEIE
jgi:cyclophilin family peptidyl-prolyl cis-trans isomerase